MIFSFPDLDTLRLAISSGTVPTDIALAPVRAGMDDERQVWVETDARVSTAVSSELRKLGARERKKAGTALDWQLSCWPQILPMVRDPAGQSPGDKTAVLFEIAGADQLAEIVGEILRLGNDRQSFRWLEEGAKGKALLRVVGPPYYSLLRAIERPARADAPRVFVEERPRVWSELGYSHPLADRLTPPAGRWLLLGPEREWTLVDESRFRDIYEVLDFAVPAGEAADWRDVELSSKLRVPLGLTRTSATEPDELWVLEEDGPRQLDDLVKTSDNRLMSRLAFAVGEHEGNKVVVLRVRPGKQTPPVLVLKGTGYRPYLKLANLFLPSGMRLHPPLRRDAVKNLLAADGAKITWLAPGVARRDMASTFVPHSLPETAFRPLEDWVEYVLDMDQKPLLAWSAAMKFEFEPFVCREEEDERAEKKARQPADEKKKSSRESSPVAASSSPSSLIDRVIEKLKPKKAKGEGAPSEDPLEMQALRDELQRVEATFQALKSPLDDPQRQDLWLRLATLHTQLGQSGDASIAWLYSLWELEQPPAAMWLGWLSAESRDRNGPTPQTLDKLLEEPNPSPAQLNVLAAALSWGASDSNEESQAVGESLVARLGQVQQYLTRYDGSLPIRAAWLAWLALARLSGGDSLSLARARDRILERLFQRGLTPDRDLPTFLRAAGLVSGDRFRAVRDQIVRLHRRVRDWCEHDAVGPVLKSLPWTREYVDLMFAYAHARLGDPSRTHEILKRKTPTQGLDEVHRWLGRAFEYRIRQALEGRTDVTPLAPQLLAELAGEVTGTTDAAKAQRMARYKIEQVRAHSRILEPHERVDPYRVFQQQFADDLGRELARLMDLTNRDELEQRLGELLSGELRGGDDGGEARIVTTALELAPRLGAEFAQRALARVIPTVDICTSGIEKALLLERGLLVAAHFDQPAHVASLVKSFHGLLDSPRGGETLKGLDSLMGESFRGLRKLGMRDEIAQLLDRMALQVARMSSAAGKGKPGELPSDPASLNLLLQVAGGWFYFGQDERAWPVLDQVRDLLIDGRLAGDFQTRHEHLRMACAYAKALGKAPVDEAMLRLDDLFTHLRGIFDDKAMNSHYSQSKLNLVEAVVLSLVSDDFNVDPAGRKWLDDDEFLVRRRIHRDVRGAIGS